MTTATTTVTRQTGRYFGLSLFAAALVAIAVVLIVVPDLIIRDGSEVPDEWPRFVAAALLGLAVAVVASIRSPNGPAAMTITAVMFAALSAAALIWSRIDDSDTLETWFFVAYIIGMPVIAALIALGSRTELVAIESPQTAVVEDATVSEDATAAEDAQVAAADGGQDPAAVD